MKTVRQPRSKAPSWGTVFVWVNFRLKTSNEKWKISMFLSVLVIIPTEQRYQRSKYNLLRLSSLFISSQRNKITSTHPAKCLEAFAAFFLNYKSTFCLWNEFPKINISLKGGENALKLSDVPNITLTWLHRSYLEFFVAKKFHGNFSPLIHQDLRKIELKKKNHWQHPVL